MYYSYVLFKIILLMICSYLAISKDCPNVSLVDNFNLTSYLGEWHEIKSYPNENQLDIECVTAKYWWSNVTGEITVLNSGLNKTSGQPYVREGRAKQNPGSSNPANISVDFSGQGTFMGQYWVLDTNYNTFSLVYSCRVKEDGNLSEFAWILSREKDLGEDQISKLTKILSDAESDTSQFVATCGAQHSSLTLSLALITLIYLLSRIIT